MEIEKIIYETTRGLFNLEDKLSITTLCIACYQSGAEPFANLLYSNDYQGVVDFVNQNTFQNQSLLSIDLSNPTITKALQDTIEELKKKYDANGFYKAVHDGDKFALAIVQMAKMFENKKWKKL